MDKAAPAHQAVLRDVRERGEDPIWIAVSVYVLVAIVKKRLGLEASLYRLMQLLSVTIFEKMPLQTALSSDEPKSDTSIDSNQLNSFGF